MYLLLFKVASVLKVNLGKSILVGMGSCPNLEGMTEILDCKVQKLPLTYLGLPLGAKYKSKDIWNPMIKNFEKRLAT